MKPPFAAQEIRERGFGLVELMIAVTLGLLLTAATIQTVLSANMSQRLQSSMAQVQDAADYSFQILSRDLRMAGYIGCPSIDEVDVALIATNPPSDVRLSASQFIHSVDNTSLNPDEDAQQKADEQGENDDHQNEDDHDNDDNSDTLSSSDTVTASWADSRAAALQSAMASPSSDIIISANPASLEAGDFAVISDCVSADLFVVTSVSSTSNGYAIGHGSTASSSASLSKAYGEDAEVFGYSSASYQVKNTGRRTSNGAPLYSLYGEQRRPSSGGASPASVELIEGVENMQLQFGIDTDSNGSINSYVAASAVNDWSKVASIRVEFLLAADTSAPLGGAQTLNFNGAVLRFSDGRYRQVSTSVIALRNRLP